MLHYNVETEFQIFQINAQFMYEKCNKHWHFIYFPLLICNLCSLKKYLNFGWNLLQLLYKLTSIIAH